MADVDEIRNWKIILVGKPSGKRLRGRAERCDDKIKMGFGEVG